MITTENLSKTLKSLQVFPSTNEFWVLFTDGTGKMLTYTSYELTTKEIIFYLDSNDRLVIEESDAQLLGRTIQELNNEILKIKSGGSLEVNTLNTVFPLMEYAFKSNS